MIDLENSAVARHEIDNTPTHIDRVNESDIYESKNLYRNIRNTTFDQLITEGKGKIKVLNLKDNDERDYLQLKQQIDVIEQAR